jgi:hypothetical protein
MNIFIGHRKLIIVALVLLAVGAGVAVAEDRIQMAILLDTSNSMDGLIDQAKSQLWKVVNELARARRAGKTPVLEVALYEYGNDGLPASQGYIRRVADLTTDLDRISDELFKLTTNGGSEYCGMVIDRATSDLSWSTAKDVLKIVYIAGNETFTQGADPYTAACARAAKKGIIVNTIFCGSFDEGVQGAWKDGADRADGKYMAINQDEKVTAIATPYDADIVKLGNELNATYVGYGVQGEELKSRQATQDKNAAGMGAESTVQRSVAKASASYANESWDLLDAVQSKKVDVAKMKDDELPAPMKKMNVAEREKYVKDLSVKRADLQKKINDANEKRRQFVTDAAKNSSAKATLEQAILASVKDEAKKQGYSIK